MKRGIKPTFSFTEVIFMNILIESLQSSSLEARKREDREVKIKAAGQSLMHKMTVALR